MVPSNHRTDLLSTVEDNDQALLLLVPLRHSRPLSKRQFERHAPPSTRLTTAVFSTPVQPCFPFDLSFPVQDTEGEHSPTPSALTLEAKAQENVTLGLPGVPHQGLARFPFKALPALFPPLFPKGLWACNAVCLRQALAVLGFR